jgi:hypothetical protein
MINNNLNPNWTVLISSWNSWLFFVALSLLFPALGIILYKRFKKLSELIKSNKWNKATLYGSIIIAEWILVILLVIIDSKHSISLNDIGERVGFYIRSFWISIFLLLILAILVFQNIRQLKRTNLEELEKSLIKLRFFLPSSFLEWIIFVIMIMTTGICEEILYRGWLINFLIAITSSKWIGVLFSSAIFGLAHTYQGKQGIMSSSIIGLIFGITFIFVQSLIPSQIIHVVINLTNGIVGVYALSLLELKSTKQKDNVDIK